MTILKLRTSLIGKFKNLSNNFNPVFKKNLASLSLKKTNYCLSRVLSIDRNKICQKGNATHLEKLGYLVELVGTAREALEKLATSRYKIIFLDISLPDCSSDLIINLIRNDERNANKNTPIILTSSWLNDSIRKNYLTIGANKVFTKPLIAMDFKKIVLLYG